MAELLADKPELQVASPLPGEHRKGHSGNVKYETDDPKHVHPDDSGQR